jgi:predicted acetyltransferase
MIRYLGQEEKRESLLLWREAFLEDSDRFLRYYYREKTKDNRILVKEEGDRIVSMIHRNPYRLQVGDHVRDVDYVVAVATAEDRRRRGLMRSLLTRMMEDQYREEMGFCFLMPADVRIYAPFDFVTVCRQPRFTLNGRGRKLLERQRIRRKGQDILIAARWMERWLKERYDVFARRTPEYVRRLLLELESEDGWMEFLTSAGTKAGEESYGERTIEGLWGWWGIEKKEQRMLFAGEEWTEPEAEEGPVIMVRIIHLKTFLRSIKLSPKGGSAPLSVRLGVRDGVCRENNGVFLWTIKKDGSCLLAWEEGMEAQERLEVSIGQLTGWLLGGEGCKGFAWMERVKGLSRIFLDEVV